MSSKRQHNGHTYHISRYHEPARIPYNGGRDWNVVEATTGLIVLGCFPNRRAARHYATHCAPYTPRFK